MNTSKSLWGQLPLADVTRTPIIILRQQATILTELTNGLLEGVVTNRTTGETHGVEYTSRGEVEKEFNAILSISAPALDGYTFRILRVDYDLDLYPVTVSNLVSKSFYAINLDRTTCDDEKEFLTAVSTILTSDEVREVIGKLWAQSKSVTPEESNFI